MKVQKRGGQTTIIIINIWFGCTYTNNIKFVCPPLFPHHLNPHTIRPFDEFLNEVPKPIDMYTWKKSC